MQLQQMRNMGNRAHWANRWMKRDVIRRQLVGEYNNERIRLNAIRKNKILPKELQVGMMVYTLW